MARPKGKEVPEDEYVEACDDQLGWCTTCRKFTNAGVDPDAENNQCEICEEFTVFGAEQALLHEYIVFPDPDED